jgi:pilus assembly protein CpaF
MRFSEELKGIPMDLQPDGGKSRATMHDVDIREAASQTRNLAELKFRIHAALVDMLDPELVGRLPEEQRRRELRRTVETLVEQERALLSQSQRTQLIEEVLDEVLGLGPLEQLLHDPSISDILVNGAHDIYVERQGNLERSPVEFRDNNHLLEIIRRIVARVGRRVDESSPMADARLPDGSRVNAIIPPLALKGPLLSIRRFGTHALTMEELLAHTALTPEMARFLEAAVRARLNVIISGGTGSGKTTMLNALSAFIPRGERIVTIEDAAELQLQQEHVAALESRPPNVEGKGAVTIRDLLRNALRMRPNRIIIGECRGAEALDMLQAMNTGHAGSMTTLHANSPCDALARLEMMIMTAGLELPLRAMRQQIASSVHLLVQVERLSGGARRVIGMTELVGMDQDNIVLQDLFVFEQQGLDAEGKAIGEFRATGTKPHFAEHLKASGVELPADLFESRCLRCI